MATPDETAVLATLQRAGDMLGTFRQNQLATPASSTEAYQIGLCLLISVATSLQQIATALSGPIVMEASTSSASPPVTTTTITLP